ncbi:MAG: YkgJ family cysteine cluster protein [Desulfopila sp.]
MKKVLYYISTLPLVGVVQLIWMKIRGKEFVVTGKCSCCGQCCNQINLRYHKGWIRSEEQFLELVKTNPEYDRFVISSMDNSFDNGGFLQFRCSLYDSHLGCSDYANRLDICRNYPQKTLRLHGGVLFKECGYSVTEGVAFGHHLDAEIRKQQKNN